MHQPKPKSAPARIKSKLVKNRTNAMKEIEAWVRKDGETFPVPEASRMSGQLTDNVTEERMLKAKLWELSKERYKFLSQNSYEQKVFSDRQNRKAGLRRVASASWDGRPRTVAGRLGGTDHAVVAARDRHSSLGAEPSDETAAWGGLPPKKAKPKNARFSLLDRLDPTKKRPPRSKSSDAKLSGTDVKGGGHSTPSATENDAPGDKSKILKTQLSRADVTIPIVSPDSVSTSDKIGKGFAPHLRPCTSHLPSSGGRRQIPSQDSAMASALYSDGRANSAAPALGMSEKPPTTPTIPTDCNEDSQASHHHHHHHHRHHHQRHHHHRHHHHHDPPKEVASLSSVEATKDKTTVTISSGANSRATSASRRDADGLEILSNKANRSPPRYGGHVRDNTTRDPRYARLEKTLCPLVQTRATGNVSSIVNQIEALHVRPRKRPPDAKKTKIELKAFEYMKEKGFVF